MGEVKRRHTMPGFTKESKESCIERASKFLLCHVHPMKFVDLARRFPKGELEKKKDLLKADDRFSLFEEKGELMIGRQGIGEEEEAIRVNALEWKERVMVFFRENGLQTPVKLSELTGSVSRADGVDSSSIPAKLILEADNMRKFDLVDLRIRPADVLVKYVYSQEEWGRYKHENSLRLEGKKEEWRKRIISHLLKQKVSVRLNTLGVSAKKPSFLPPKIKCSDVIRDDPLKRFQVTGTSGYSNERGKNDGGSQFVSLSKDFLAEHWRLQIVRHMEAQGVDTLLLSDLGNVVPRPYMLPRQSSLVDVITTDPLQRFYYTCKNDVRRVKLLSEEEKKVVFGESNAPTATSSPSSSSDGWTTVGEKPNVTKPHSLGAWGKKINPKVYSPPPGLDGGDKNSEKLNAGGAGRNGIVKSSVKIVDSPCVNAGQNGEDDRGEGAVMDTVVTSVDIKKGVKDTVVDNGEEVKLDDAVPNGEGDLLKEQQVLEVSLMESARNDLFDIQSSVPGLFSAFGDKSESYFQGGHVDMELNYGLEKDPLHILSLGRMGDSVQMMVPSPPQKLPVSPPAPPGLEKASNERIWIRDWLPKTFDGFPTSLVDQFANALEEEGMVSVQDLLTAQDLGQLTLSYFRDIGINCKLGHYNRLVWALSKFR